MYLWFIVPAALISLLITTYIIKRQRYIHVAHDSSSWGSRASDIELDQLSWHTFVEEEEEGGDNMGGGGYR